MSKIAACMIVKNSEGSIERCLDSIRPFVDEVNIYDTGSTDKTLTILAALNKKTHVWHDPSIGAFVPKPTKKADKERINEVPLAPIKVQKGEWREDFAWARTQSFAMASEDCEWFIWMDDDDEVIGAQHLRQIAMGAHPNTDGFVVYYDYAQDENGMTMCQLWRERLIRRTPDGEWINPIHEVWLPHGETGAANYVGLPKELLRYKHSRPVDRYENDRNLKILEVHAQGFRDRGEPLDLRTKAYLGSELAALGRPAEAVPHFTDYLEDPRSTTNDERSQCFHKLAMCLSMLGQTDAALNVEFDAIKERDDWTENLVGLSEAFWVKGNIERSMEWAKRAIEKGMPQSPMILNPLELELLPRIRMAECLGALGRFDDARAYLQQAFMIRPGDPQLTEMGQRFDHDDTQQKIVSAVMTLRETLIRHDENWKAWKLFDAIPYIVKDHPMITSAKAMTRENVMHAIKPEEYRRWYEDEPKESTVPDEHVEILGNGIERAGFTLEMCETFEKEHGRKPRVLDLGANDAWMACFLWKKGEYVSDGIEMNKASVEKGLKRLERFGAPGRLVQGDIHDAGWLSISHTGRFLKPVDGEWVSIEEAVSPEKYDIVTCYEVYEHVPDTERLIQVMEEVLSPEGLAMITTPAGAYEQGNLEYWQAVERKGHLRAVTPDELADQLLERGTLEEFRIHQSSRLSWAAWRPSKKRGRVNILAGGSWEPWSPLSIRDGGLGGSETALVQLAGGLSKKDWDVRVFADTDPGGVFAQMLWRPSAAFDPTEEADAIIVSRNPGAFNVELHAPTTILWAHDHTYELTELQAKHMTHFACLSEWHKARMLKLYPELLKDKIEILRNGILTVGYEDANDVRFPHQDRPFAERDATVIYSSSADRGLDQLLTMWPAIKERVPKAELNIYYGWNVFDAVAQRNPGLWAYKAKVMELFEKAGGEDGGVHMLGRVGQPEMYEAMQKARVWGYPGAFLETSCIGAMEARAAGLAVVCSDLGALKETVGEHGVLIPWSEEEDSKQNEDPIYQTRFVDEVCSLLSHEHSWNEVHARAVEGVSQLDWRYRISEWEALIESGRSH